MTFGGNFPSFYDAHDDGPGPDVADLTVPVKFDAAVQFVDVRFQFSSSFHSRIRKQKSFFLSWTPLPSTP